MRSLREPALKPDESPDRQCKNERRHEREANRGQQRARITRFLELAQRDPQAFRGEARSDGDEGRKTFVGIGGVWTAVFLGFLRERPPRQTLAQEESAHA